MVLDSRTSVSPRGAKEPAAQASTRQRADAHAPEQASGAAPDALDPTVDQETARGLHDAAQGAVSPGANALRDVRERYRAAHMAQLERWE